MGSTANVTGSNLELTPMRVTFDGVDLGGTLDGVAVGIQYKLSDLMADQMGSTPIDSRISGQEFTVKLRLAEIQNFDNWLVAFPHASLEEAISPDTEKAIYFDAQIGGGMLAKAKELVLHPLSKDDADLSGDFMFWKAVASSASEVKYGPEEQSALEVEFKIYPDTATSPARFFIYGDASLAPAP